MDKLKVIYSKWSKKQKIVAAIGSCVVILAAIYLVFSIYFMSHFNFGTVVNGVKSGGYSVSRLERAITEEIDGYVLKIEERNDRAEEIAGADIDLQPEFDGSLQALLSEQNGFAWIATLIHGQELQSETVVNYDETKLEKEIAALDCMKEENQTESEDAYISDYTNDGYEIVPEVYGTVIDESVFADKIADAVSNLQETFNIAEESGYIEPKLLADSAEMQALLEKMTLYTSTKVTYTFGDEKELLAGDTISQWITVEGTNAALDAESLAAYVKELARNHNTVFRNRTLKTSYGSTVTIEGGDYGWWIDQEAELVTLQANVEAGETVEREPEYKQTANSYDENDYGNTYVEINLTAQHLYFYKDGTLVVESDFVSGNPSKGNATPVGAYGLTYKELDATLNGENYSTPVQYWMPFNNNVGMHDATWRGSFGGAIYRTNGSHGCINLPYGVAEKIYENIEKGDAVLVYELPGTESYDAASMNAGDAVEASIAAIGNVTWESAATIAAARAAYDALTETAKTYVGNYDVLVASEAVYAQMQADAAVAAADSEAATQAAEVISQIDAIGRVTEDSRDAIRAARNAYDDLSDAAKAKVTNLNKLESAEEAYRDLQ